MQKLSMLCLCFGRLAAIGQSGLLEGKYCCAVIKSKSIIVLLKSDFPFYLVETGAIGNSHFLHLFIKLVIQRTPLFLQYIAG